MGDSAGQLNSALCPPNLALLLTNVYIRAEASMLARVNGETVYYNYFRDGLFSGATPLSRELIAKAITDLAVWLPPSLYVASPILYPYAHRRRESKRKRGDMSAEGYFLDDNHLINQIAKSLDFACRAIGNRKDYRISGKYDACHIWQHLRVHRTVTAAYLPLTFSFVPNLVWLPQEIAKVTNIEGHYAQKVLKTLSYMIYYQRRHDAATQSVWRLLDNPDLQLAAKPIRPNFFRLDERQILTRRANLIRKLDTILIILSAGTRAHLAHVTSYPNSLVRLSDPHKKALRKWLAEYKRRWLKQTAS
jgi:DNA-binding MarR family transcriptional regulator